MNCTDEIDALFGECPLPTNKSIKSDPESQKEVLKAARNARRGHPKAGEPKRPRLMQVNIKCDNATRALFDAISLAAGKTKRELFREATNILKGRYLR